MRKMIVSGKAQAMTEYILVVASVAVFCLLFAKISKLIMIRHFENLVFIFQLPIP